MTDMHSDDRMAVTGRRGDKHAMVPEASFTSYYGKPVLNKPTWQARDIASYLFLGGLAGASSVLAAGAQLTGRDTLARGCRTGALVAISGSLYALVHDLGRPARFVNMLRTVKPTSHQHPDQRALDLNPHALQTTDPLEQVYWSGSLIHPW